MVLRTLLWQMASSSSGETKDYILRQIVARRRKLKAKREHARPTPEELFDSSKEMWDLITKSRPPGVSELRLIIDDIESCDPAFRRRLATLLANPDSNLHLKLIVTSRHLASSMTEELQIETVIRIDTAESTGVIRDVEHYIRTECKKMQQVHLLENDFVNQLENELLEGAAGNFLWTVCSVKNIHQQLLTWSRAGKAKPWQFDPSIVPSEGLDAMFRALVVKLSTIGVQALKWDAITADFEAIRKADLLYLFRQCGRYKVPEAVSLGSISEDVQPLGAFDEDDDKLAPFHPSLYDYLTRVVITEDDKQDLAVLCLSTLLTEEYTSATLQLLAATEGWDPSEDAGASHLADVKAGTQILGFDGNIQPPFVGYSCRNWFRHIGELKEPGREVIELLQRLYTPGKQYFEAWHNHYWLLSGEKDPEGDTELHYSDWICEAEKLSLLHIAAECGSIPFLERLLPLTAASRRAGPQPAGVTFRWHAKRVLDPTAPTYDSADSAGRTLLMWAAYYGHRELVDALLVQGANLDTTDKEGSTALSYAAMEGYSDIVQDLLNRGVANPDVQNMAGESPLMLAAGNACKDVITVLCADSRVDINRKNNKGQSALSLAASSGNQDAARLLLEFDCIDVNTTDNDGWTPLIYAAYNNHEEISRFLLDNEHVNVEHSTKTGGTALSTAAGEGYQQLVELLLEQGNVDVNTRDQDEITPLAYAALYGHEKIVQTLLNEGNAEIESRDHEGRTPLCLATRHGHEAVVKILLDNLDVDVEAQDNDGWTPLCYAVTHGHLTISQILLEANANIEHATKAGRSVFSLAASCTWVNGTTLRWMIKDVEDVNFGSTDEDGWCALMWAAFDGLAKNVHFLLHKAEMDPNRESPDGCTAFIYAAKKGYDEVIKVFQEHGKANFDHKDHEGCTALSHAAANGHEAVVKTMLDLGVDVNLKDTKGYTPLEHATPDHPVVMELLQERGGILDDRAADVRVEPESESADDSGIGRCAESDDGSTGSVTRDKVEEPGMWSSCETSPRNSDQIFYNKSQLQRNTGRASCISSPSSTHIRGPITSSEPTSLQDL